LDAVRKTGSCFFKEETVASFTQSVAAKNLKTKTSVMECDINGPWPYSININGLYKLEPCMQQAVAVPATVPTLLTKCLWCFWVARTTALKIHKQQFATGFLSFWGVPTHRHSLELSWASLSNFFKKYIIARALRVIRWSSSNYSPRTRVDLESRLQELIFFSNVKGYVTIDHVLSWLHITLKEKVIQEMKTI